MTQVLLFAILGLAQGSAYALMAQGLVLVYRGSGVLNFAHAAFGMTGAYAYYELTVNHGWATVPALAGGVLVAACLGLGTQAVVMRRLREAAPLTRMIATLGLFLFLTEGIVLIYQDHAFSAPSVLPVSRVSLGLGYTVGVDELSMVALAVLVTVALAGMSRRTRFGLASSAVAESEVAVATLGWSPSLIAAVNWTLGGALSGLAAILITSSIGLSTDLGLLIIPALAAALVGRFESFYQTLLAALAIGVAVTEATRYISAPGWGASLPFLVIIAILVLRGRSLPHRGERAPKLPRAGTGRPRPAPLILAIAAAAVLLEWALPLSWIAAVTSAMLFAVVLLSLVVVTGMAGQLSVVQYTLAGVGALIATRATITVGLPFPAALLAGVIGAMPVALLVGLPALRLRGVNLAVVTLAAGYVAQNLVFSNNHITGGYDGTPLPSPSLFGWSVDGILHPQRFALLALAALAASALMVMNIRRGRVGRRMLAVRANERAAASLGVNITAVKLYAFVIGGALAALAGVLLAYQNSFAVFSRYDVIGNIYAVALGVIGGIGSVVGALVGGAAAPDGIVAQAFSSLGDITQWVLLFGGLAVMLTAMFMPDGAALETLNSLRRPRAWYRRGTRGRAAPARPASRKPQGTGEPQPAVAAAGTATSLEITGLSVSYGGVTALKDVSLRVEPGEVVGLIGPNGAGKTTLIDAVTGFTRPHAGSVLLGGQDVTAHHPSQLARRGLGRSFQSLELFEDMTVEENLLAAVDRQDALAYLTSLVRPGRHQLNAAAMAAVEEFGLGECLPQLPGELPAGRRQLVALARAVSARPGVLLLDEPAAGLDSAETEAIGGLIRRLADVWGMAVLLVEHDTELVFSICDRVVVLDFGRRIASDAPSQVRADAAVLSAYLGAADQTAGHPGNLMTEMKGLQP
jgi:ABC-type branched-subunit amino acid transport system ATPase component/ABC-type branched-subunit amino acid transport system permease subunit